MDDMETILDELNCFEKKKTKEITPLLEDYLTRIAKTGDIIFPWNKLKPLVIYKMEQVMADFRRDYPIEHIAQYPNVEKFAFEIMREKLVETVDQFTCAPFTIQRLCELVTTPRKHYKRTDKFMRGLEKNVLVVSTLEPLNGNHRNQDGDSSPGSMVNGVVDNNFNNHHEYVVSDYRDHVENIPNPASPQSTVDVDASERETAASPPVDVESCSSSECDVSPPDEETPEETSATLTTATTTTPCEESTSTSTTTADEAVAVTVDLPNVAAGDTASTTEEEVENKVVVTASSEEGDFRKEEVDSSGEVVTEAETVEKSEQREEAHSEPIETDNNVLIEDKSIESTTSEIVADDKVEMALVESSSDRVQVQIQHAVDESMESSSEPESSSSTDGSSSTAVEVNMEQEGDRTSESYVSSSEPMEQD